MKVYIGIIRDLDSLECINGVEAFSTLEAAIECAGCGGSVFESNVDEPNTAEHGELDLEPEPPEIPVVRGWKTGL